MFLFSAIHFFFRSVTVGGYIDGSIDAEKYVWLNNLDKNVLTTFN